MAGFEALPEAKRLPVCAVRRARRTRWNSTFTLEEFLMKRLGVLCMVLAMVCGFAGMSVASDTVRVGVFLP